MRMFAVLAAVLLADPGAASGLALPSAPPLLGDDLAVATAALLDVQHCANRNKYATWRVTSETLTKRYSAVEARASGLFGWDVYQGATVGWTKPLCTDAIFDRAAKTAGGALDRAEARLAPVEQPLQRGLWLGAIPVCADWIMGTSTMTGAHHGESLYVTAKPEFRGLLRAYQQKFQSRDSPAKIRFYGEWISPLEGPNPPPLRLDGEILRVSTWIYTDGQISIQLRGHGAAITEATGRACAASGGEGAS